METRGTYRCSTSGGSQTARERSLCCGRDGGALFLPVPRLGSGSWLLLGRFLPERMLLFEECCNTACVEGFRVHVRESEVVFPVVSRRIYQLGEVSDEIRRPCPRFEKEDFKAWTFDLRHIAANIMSAECITVFAAVLREFGFVEVIARLVVR